MPTEAELAAKAEQDKQAAEAKAKADADAKAAADAKEKGKTMGEIDGHKKPEEPRLVPESVLIEQKRATKALEKEVERLKAEGAKPKEIKKSIKELAEKNGVDPEFAQELADTIRADADADVDNKIAEKLKPIEDEKRAKQADEVFEAEWAKALERNPKYKDIAKKNTVKALGRDPLNSTKTIDDLLEDEYSQFIPGKKTLEPTKHRGGGQSEAIDFKRAETDVEYRREILADPDLKKEYNKTLTDKVRKII